MTPERPTRRAPAPLSLVPRLRTVWPEPEAWRQRKLAARMRRTVARVTLYTAALARHADHQEEPK